MGFIVGLFMTGMILYGMYLFVRSSKARHEFWKETMERPAYAAYVAVWVACTMTFFWGVLAPRFGQIEVTVLGTDFELWQLGGMGALVGLVVSFFVKDY